MIEPNTLKTLQELSKELNELNNHKNLNKEVKEKTSKDITTRISTIKEEMTQIKAQIFDELNKLNQIDDPKDKANARAIELISILGETYNKEDLTNETAKTLYITITKYNKIIKESPHNDSISNIITKLKDYINESIKLQPTKKTNKLPNKLDDLFTYLESFIQDPNTKNKKEYKKLSEDVKTKLATKLNSINLFMGNKNFTELSQEQKAIFEKLCNFFKENNDTTISEIVKKFKHRTEKFINFYNSITGENLISTNELNNFQDEVNRLSTLLRDSAQKQVQQVNAEGIANIISSLQSHTQQKEQQAQDQADEEQKQQADADSNQSNIDTDRLNRILNTNIHKLTKDDIHFILSLDLNDIDEYHTSVKDLLYEFYDEANNADIGDDIRTLRDEIIQELQSKNPTELTSEEQDLLGYHDGSEQSQSDEEHQAGAEPENNADQQSQADEEVSPEPAIIIDPDDDYIDDDGIIDIDEKDVIGVSNSVSEKEQREIIDGIYNSETFESYKDSIQPVISDTAIARALNLANMSTEDKLQWLINFDKQLEADGYDPIVPPLTASYKGNIPDNVIENNYKHFAFDAIKNIDTYKEVLGDDFSEEKAIALNHIDTALSSYDDLLIAYERTLEIERKRADGKKLTKEEEALGTPEQLNNLQNVIKVNLARLEEKDINPEDAWILLHLARDVYKQSPHPDSSKPIENPLYLAFENKIAVAIKKYDVSNFGDIKPAELQKINEAIAKHLHPRVGVTPSFIQEHCKKYLDDNFTIVDDNNKQLKNNFWGKDTTRYQSAIINTASAIALRKLQKNKDFINLNNKDQQKAILDEMEKAINEILHDKNHPERNKFTTSEINGYCANKMVECEGYQKRIAQKWKDEKICENISKRLKKIDNSLVNKLGKPYKVTKKFARIIRKVAPTAIKQASLFTLASFVPGGVPCLIAYNTVKSVKQAYRQITDKNTSTGEKAWAAISTTITTALSAMTAGVGLAEYFDGTSLIQLAKTASENMGGMWGRVGINTAIMATPHIITIPVLNHKRSKLKKQIAEETDPKKLKVLIKQEKVLTSRIQQNAEQLTSKVTGTAAGLIFGSMLNEIATNALRGGNSSEESPKDQDNANVTEENDYNNGTPNGAQPEVPNHSETEQTPSEETDITSDDVIAVGKDGSVIFKDGTIVTQDDILIRDGKLVLEDADKYIKAADNIEDYAREINPQTANEIFGNEVDIQNTDNVADNNLQEALNAKVHPSGLSVHEMLENDISRTQHITNLENPTDIADTMSKIYGDDAYMATHAALADPANVVAEIKSHMSAEDFSKLDISETPTSAELINCMAEHPELASNQGLTDYFQDHFDAQQRFHYTDQPAPVHNQTTYHANNHSAQTVVENTPKTVVENTLTNVADNTPQTVVDTPSHVEPQPLPEVTAQQPAPYGSEAWFKQNGLVHVPGLTREIPHHSDYAFAALNPNTNQIYIYPDDPTARSVLPLGQLDQAWHFAETNAGVFNPNSAQYSSVLRNDINNHYRSAYGSGITTHYGTVPVHTNSVPVQSNQDPMPDPIYSNEPPQKSGFDKFIEGAAKVNAVLDVIEHTTRNVNDVTWQVNQGAYNIENLGNTIERIKGGR